MRTHGTLCKWNDQRGFGFIRPTKGSQELFVHVSSFPADGRRPQLNELVSFDVESGPDGSQRAVRIQRTAQAPRIAPPRQVREPSRQRLHLSRGLIAALVLGSAAAYFLFRDEPAPATPVTFSPADTPDAQAVHYSCDGRTMCPEMRSCAEARFFIRNCPNTKMDGDRDGEPCEDQWCH